MTMKMKGLLKGLRYISTIFEEEGKEKEMQIGLPTDVKHVAHIGYDGPTASNPSWIENFRESGGGGEGGVPTNGDQQTAAKPRTLAGSEQLSLESPSRRRSDKPKVTRRASSASASDSPRRSSTSNSEESRNKTEGGDKISSKPSLRRKKTKSGSSTKSKATGTPSDSSHYSDPGMVNDMTRPDGTALGADQTRTGRKTKGKDTCLQGSVLKMSSDQEDEKKSLDDISRGIQAM